MPWAFFIRDTIPAAGSAEVRVVCVPLRVCLAITRLTQTFRSAISRSDVASRRSPAVPLRLRGGARSNDRGLRPPKGVESPLFVDPIDAVVAGLIQINQARRSGKLRSSFKTLSITFRINYATRSIEGFEMACGQLFRVHRPTS